MRAGEAFPLLPGPGAGRFNGILRSAPVYIKGMIR